MPRKDPFAGIQLSEQAGSAKLDQLLSHVGTFHEEQIALPKQSRKAGRPMGQPWQNRHVVAVKCGHQRHGEPRFHGQNQVSLLPKVGV